MKLIDDTHIHGCAAVDHQNGIFEVLRDKLKLLKLFGEKLKVSILQLFIPVFTGLPCNNEDCSFCVGRNICLCDHSSCRENEGIVHHIHKGSEIRGILCRFFALLVISANRFIIAFLITLKPRLAGDFKARVFQAIVDIHRIALVYFATSGSTLNRTDRAASKQSDLLTCKRQAAVVCQKDNALCCRTIRDFSVF